jgi:hypothetical protein
MPVERPPTQIPRQPRADTRGEIEAVREDMRTMGENHALAIKTVHDRCGTIEDRVTAADGKITGVADDVGEVKTLLSVYVGKSDQIITHYQEKERRAHEEKLAEANKGVALVQLEQTKLSSRTKLATVFIGLLSAIIGALTGHLA